MDREGFRNRLNQYKKAREENPGLKYWEWKDVPKYDEGTGGVTLKEKEDAFWRGDTQKMAELVEREGKQLTYVTPQSNMDEVVITANKPKQNRYSELDFAKDVAGFVPVLGDAVDIYDAGKSLYNGNYSQAALLSAGLLLPNWLEKSGKLIAKGIKNYLLDRRYLKAIKNGDLETAQRLRDEHFQSAAKNTKVIDADGKPKRLYHGTNASYNTYDPSFFGTATDDGYYGVGLYATEDFNTARSYGDVVKTLYANVEYPYTAGVYDVTGKPYPIKVATERSGVVSLFNRDLSRTNVPQEFKYLLPELQKADGVFYSIPNMRFNEVVIPKSSQMKYADAVAYDDNGKIIRLSKRDDFDNPDMRYAEGGEVLEQYYAPKTVEGILAKTAIQLADPTGVSSYPDVWYSGKKFLNSPSWSNLKDVGINTLSALPLIGKVTAPFKAAKMAKLLARIEDANALVKGVENANRLNKVIDTVPELLPVVRRGAKKVQDVTSALVTNPIFDYMTNRNKFDLVRNYRNMNAAVDAVNISNNTADVAQGIESLIGYSDGGQVEPDPLEVLERSKPKVAGIPINDRPLSGTDPIGEAMMWGLGGGAASAALRSMFPTYGATIGWLAFGDNNKDNMLVVPNNPTKNTTPIETGLLNKEIRQYYADDVLPRDILTSEADKLRFLNTDKNFEYDLYPQAYFSNGVAGHYDRLDDKIRLNGGYSSNKDLLDNVMAHEVNHRYNREFPLDKEHNRILNRAYTVQSDLDTRAARAARKPLVPLIS